GGELLRRYRGRGRRGGQEAAQRVPCTTRAADPRHLRQRVRRADRGAVSPTRLVRGIPVDLPRRAHCGGGRVMSGEGAAIGAVGVRDERRPWSERATSAE